MDRWKVCGLAWESVSNGIIIKSREGYIINNLLGENYTILGKCNINNKKLDYKRYQDSDIEMLIY